MKVLDLVVRHSNRTFNKLLKIKVTNPACDAYEEEDENTEKI